MTGEDLWNAIGCADEKFLEHSEKVSKSGSLSGRIKWASRAACFCLAAVGIGILLRPATVPTRDWNSTGITTEVGAIIPPWEEKSVCERFPYFTQNGTSYGASRCVLPTDKISDELGKTVLQGKDVYSGKVHITDAVIYKIEGISTQCAAALRFPEQGDYYVYINSDYWPETLGQFLSDLSLPYNLTSGAVWKESAGTLTECTGLDTSVVWELLLSEPELTTVRFEEADLGKRLMSISVNVRLLGIENVSIAVTENGYLTTNILGLGKAYFIGTERVHAFTEYVETHCEKREHTRTTDTTAPVIWETGYV